MKTKAEITKKKIQYNKDSNKLTGGRSMKYFLILSTILITGLFARYTDNATGWELELTTGLGAGLKNNHDNSSTKIVILVQK